MSDVWKVEVGRAPHRVVVHERPEKKHIVYLMWWVNGEKQRKSLGQTIRDDRGRIVQGRERWAVAEAEAKYRKLVSGAPDEAPVEEVLLTLGATEEVLLDRETGKYPEDTLHRRDVLRCLRYAVRVWGPGTTWASLRKADLRALWRRVIDETGQRDLVGIRSAEVMVQRILSVARWLKDEERIPVECCLPDSRWKEKLREDWRVLRKADHVPDPNRPRFTVEESLRIIRAARQVDPRFGLLLMLGAELRAGQVERTRRTAVTFLDNGEVWLDVKGRGKKLGERVLLTVGQKAALAYEMQSGYLRTLEAAYHAGAMPDYPLFPASKLRGKRTADGEPYAPVTRTTAISRTAKRDWFTIVRDRLGLPKVAGRGLYGIRRVGTDFALDEGAEGEVLAAWGAWRNDSTPKLIYASTKRTKAARKASEIRAKFRGESEPPAGGADGPA